LHNPRNALTWPGSTTQRSVNLFLFYSFLFSFSEIFFDDDSGLTAYNHNLDTSREFYPSVRRLPLSTSLTVILKLIGYYDPIVRWPTGYNRLGTRCWH
jgi:hypothetical protein